LIYRYFLFLSFLTLSLFARYDAVAVKSCPAFNNMKHTQNTGHVMRHPQENYTVLRKHKGQMLLLLKGENPAQRWVDEACFSDKRNSKENDAYTKHTKKYERNVESQDLLLALSWHNAFCETHRGRKECQRRLFPFGKKSNKENRFVLHGLWPQPKQRVYCGVQRRYITADKYKQWHKLPEPELKQETKEALRRVMPGVDSNLHRHEWIKHGTCYGTDAQIYFQDAIALTEEVRSSEVARFFQKYAGKRVSIEKVRHLFDKSFGAGAGRHVELRCNRGMITELWLHLGSGENKELSSLLQNGKRVHSRCQRGIIDSAGYGRNE
jgi:ribonuclease T2